MPSTRNVAVIVHHASDATSPWLLVAIAAAAALLGVAIGRLSAGRRSRPTPPVRPAGPARSVPTPAPVVSASPTDDRTDQLALACLHLADSVKSAVLRADIDRALRQAGYEPLDPVGQPFDPAVHQAVERRGTTDARTHNVVAATYRTGWAGRGQLLRSPEVAVYRLEASTS